LSSGHHRNSAEGEAVQLTTGNNRGKKEKATPRKKKKKLEIHIRTILSGVITGRMDPNRRFHRNFRLERARRGGGI